MFSAAIEAGRYRTKQHFRFRKANASASKGVTGKSWSGYNWYQGGFQSLIQVNTDLPIFIDRAVDLACHEGYPGHHVYNVLLEKNLVRDRHWVEFSVYPLFSPQSLIAEGSANFGIEVAFPGAERVAFERDVLYPIAGIDPARAADYSEVQKLAEGLSYAGNEAARRYLNGEISASQAADWLEEYGLSSRPRAEQRVRFIDQYRSYVINYNLGKDLVRSWIESQGGAAAGKALGGVRAAPLLAPAAVGLEVIAAVVAWQGLMVEVGGLLAAAVLSVAGYVFVYATGRAGPPDPLGRLQLLRLPAVVVPLSRPVARRRARDCCGGEFRPSSRRSSGGPAPDDGSMRIRSASRCCRRRSSPSRTR